ncbi:ATP-binding protein [Streptomyces platensis]|uniref:ATP-binding protein n=1 Tax=Streptomyces platensis TaxID=58346 RepID=UPI002E256716|nr:ATP-binding protein [Streptomyces platensis]WTI53486.1 ATP-binding protein [Streptomyces platensis]WUB80888.1 ATP-binding protein [Streptomyces platensis]
MNQEIAERKLHFHVQLSATRRGARLARLLGTEQLRSWGMPFEVPAQVLAELAANAASHGRVPGRDFRLVMSSDVDTLRVEVTDARGDRLPAQQAMGLRESGHGLILIDALADRWGTCRGPFPCKTVWAEFDLPMWGR